MTVKLSYNAQCARTTIPPADRKIYLKSLGNGHFKCRTNLFYDQISRKNCHKNDTQPNCWSSEPKDFEFSKWSQGTIRSIQLLSAGGIVILAHCGLTRSVPSPWLACVCDEILHIYLFPYFFLPLFLWLFLSAKSFKNDSKSKIKIGGDLPKTKVNVYQLTKNWNQKTRPLTILRFW